MNEVYQMSNLEHNAFIEHCKATETYKKVFLRKGFLDEEPSQDSMAWIDWDRIHSENPEEYFVGKNGKFYSIIETKKVKVKGYNKNAPYINETEKENK